jgi:hypothetical protein
MLQFFLGATGGLAGTASLAFTTTTPVLVADRVLEAQAVLTFDTAANLNNVPVLNGTAALTLNLPDPELITPLEDDGSDDLRRRATTGDEWTFRRRKIEQLR